MTKYAGYRDLMEEMIQKNRHVRGYRTRLATAAGCHSSYFSHVMSGESHLTPDQAASLCEFWGLSEWESECFLTQVSLERAGTPALKTMLQRRLDGLFAIQEKNSKFRLEKKSLTDDQMMMLYSNWYTLAIFTALDIAALRKKEKIASYFNLPLDVVQNTLNDLASTGLVTFDGEEWRADAQALFYGYNETVLRLNHLVQRVHANQLAFRKPSGSIHQTFVMALSKGAHQQATEKLKSVFREVIDLAKNDPEPEEVFGLYLDFYKL